MIRRVGDLRYLPTPNRIPVNVKWNLSLDISTQAVW